MLGVEVIVQAAAEAVFWACTRARRLSCAAARLARQVRVICRVAAVSGVWRHRVHTTVTDLVTLVDRDGCLGLAGAAPAVPGDGDDVHRRGNAFVCPATVNVAGDALVSRNLLAFFPRILEDQGVCEVLVAEVRVALAVP
ncbi:hypothetical protein [Saccharopolyspora spinosa]|uniref:hypothetical protein n=1 Tax=Saccharopolyspora spinosa TaxID=60894 RepID=UPI00376F00A2